MIPVQIEEGCMTFRIGAGSLIADKLNITHVYRESGGYHNGSSGHGTRRP
jgi:hypothetical protein